MGRNDTAPHGPPRYSLAREVAKPHARRTRVTAMNLWYESSPALSFAPAASRSHEARRRSVARATSSERTDVRARAYQVTLPEAIWQRRRSPCFHGLRPSTRECCVQAPSLRDKRYSRSRGLRLPAV